MRKGIDHIGIGVCYFCHDGKGNYVLNKRGAGSRDEQGRWDFGGGGLELHDTIEETLRKEIKEEYAADVIESEFLGCREFFRETDEGEKTHWVALDFKVLIDPKQVKNNEPHKFDEVKLFPITDLPEPLHSQSPVYMGKYKDKLM